MKTNKDKGVKLMKYKCGGENSIIVGALGKGKSFKRGGEI